MSFSSIVTFFFKSEVENSHVDSSTGNCDVDYYEVFLTHVSNNAHYVREHGILTYYIVHTPFSFRNHAFNSGDSFSVLRGGKFINVGEKTISILPHTPLTNRPIKSVEKKHRVHSPPTTANKDIPSVDYRSEFMDTVLPNSVSQPKRGILEHFVVSQPFHYCGLPFEKDTTFSVMFNMFIFVSDKTISIDRGTCIKDSIFDAQMNK